MNCDECKFSDDMGIDDGFMFCRRNAPVPKIYGESVDGEHASHNSLVWWPRVFCGDWCGEFKPKDEETFKGAV